MSGLLAFAEVAPRREASSRGKENPQASVSKGVKGGAEGHESVAVLPFLCRWYAYAFVANATPELPTTAQSRAGRGGRSGTCWAWEVKRQRDHQFLHHAGRALSAPAEPGLQAVAVVIEARAVAPEAGVKVDFALWMLWFRLKRGGPFM